LLARLEPQAALKIHANDVQKLTRVLEIRLTTGQPLPARDTAAPLAGYAPLKIGLNPERVELYRRLDQRVLGMFREGLLEEIEALLARGMTGEEKPFQALGYKQALAHLRGKLTREEAIASTQVQTRQYAKRQLTWFRRDPEMHWLEGFGDEIEIQAQAAEMVRAGVTLD
jgi:tRNA dimethylallyltransferase